MTVSKEPTSELAGQGLNWLERELAWEAVLTGLRRRAGLMPKPDEVGEIRPAA